MDLQLQDKAIIVTGGAKGIGAAAVRAFAAEGARGGHQPGSAGNLVPLATGGGCSQAPRRITMKIISIRMRTECRTLTGKTSQRLQYGVF
jgi:hypothetical protein